MSIILAGATLTLVLLIGVAVAVAWAPDRPVDELKARWAPPPSVFVPLQGMAVHLRDEGAANDTLPILLLHGTAASLHTWDGWVAALAPSRRVIRVDLPGFGLTGPFPHDDYTVAPYLEFVPALLDSLAVPRFIVAGNSFGGQLAWEVAAATPERVAALILVDAVGYPFEPESIPIAFRFAMSPTLQPLMHRMLPWRVVEASVRNVYGDPSRVTAALVDRYYELTLRDGNRRALGRRIVHLVPGEASAARIARVSQPTLILWGRKDRLIPLKYGERFARDITGSQLVVFDHLGHVPHEEDPATTVAAVLQFLDAVEPP